MTVLLEGAISLPGDKSISHRALMMLSIAQGQGKVENLLTGQDVMSTLACMRALGSTISQLDDTTFVVKGAEALRAPESLLDCGNSGTTIRLLTGLLAGARVPATLTGDDSLKKRPLNRVMNPLSEMGAVMQAHEGRAPVQLVPPSQPLHGIRYRLPMASAQVKSAILLAGLYTPREATVIVEEPIASRDHTERMLNALGCVVSRQGEEVTLTGRQPDLAGQDILVPGDISSAAFWMVGAAICPDSQVTLRQVGINPTRLGIVHVLQQAGMTLYMQHVQDDAVEPYADIRVENSPLQGSITIGAEMVPSLVDEIPILTILGLFNDGVFSVSGAEELRVKESDRLGTLIQWLQRFGVDVQSAEDGFSFQGNPNFKPPKLDTLLPTNGDHRLIMALEILNLRAEHSLPIEGKEWVAISYPSFYQQLEQLKKQSSPRL